ncbi:alanine racemase [Streptomyces roseifaciens]
MAVNGTPPPPPSLPAHPDPATDAVLGSGLLHELAHAFGGPFHFLLPHRFDANLAAFRAALADAGVDGRVYYAKKANKAAAWIERCAAAGAGVDVASPGELREALGHGVRGENIVVTGPAKSEELLRVAALQGALTAVDSLDELDRLTAAPRAGGAPPPRLLLRVLPPEQPGSRFGLDGAELEEALAHCARAGDAVRMEGFGFHLSGYAVQPRADLAGRLVDLCLKARVMGLQADRISIGGGFAVDYAAAGDWHSFLATQQPGHYHAHRRFTPADFYPYHSPVAGAGALRAVLAAVPAGGRDSLGSRLRETGTLLLMEPGRALLDRAGSSVFRIQGVKDREGYAILTVDGTSLSLSEQWFNSEFLPDPVLVPPAGRAGGTRRNGGPGATGVHPACAGGATCLESDLLTWRKIPFPVRPSVGDLLVYPNTAGYQMDSNESPFHDLPLPPKVVIDTTDDIPVDATDDTLVGTADGTTRGGRPRWRLDRRPAC